MLDCRFYRHDPRGKNQTMLGPVQKQWLLETIRKSTGKLLVLSCFKIENEHIVSHRFASFFEVALDVLASLLVK